VLCQLIVTLSEPPRILALFGSIHCRHSLSQSTLCWVDFVSIKMTENVTTKELAVLRFSNDIVDTSSRDAAPLPNHSKEQILSAIKEALDCTKNTTLVIVLGTQCLDRDTKVAVVKLIGKSGGILALAQDIGQFLFVVVTAGGKLLSVIFVGGEEETPKESVELAKSDSSETVGEYLADNKDDDGGSVDLLLQSSDEDSNDGDSDDGEDLFNADALEEVSKKVQKIQLDDDSSDSFDDAIGLTQELY
jgi:hypothetical protein